MVNHNNSIYALGLSGSSPKVALKIFKPTVNSIQQNELDRANGRTGIINVYSETNTKIQQLFMFNNVPLAVVYNTSSKIGRIKNISTGAEVKGYNA